MSRPSKFKPEYAEQAFQVCSQFGADDKALAEFFKVGEKTINNWKKAYPAFLGAVKTGKDIFDSEKVEASLLKRAIGYKYDEIHKEAVYVQRDGLRIYEEAYQTRIITKEVAPDVTAQIFWLKNRQKNRWRDRQEVEHSGKDEGLIKRKAVELSDEELLDIICRSHGVRKVSQTSDA